MICTQWATTLEDWEGVITQPQLETDMIINGTTSTIVMSLISQTQPNWSLLLPTCSSTWEKFDIVRFKNSNIYIHFFSNGCSRPFSNPSCLSLYKTDDLPSLIMPKCYDLESLWDFMMVTLKLPWMSSSFNCVSSISSNTSLRHMIEMIFPTSSYPAFKTNLLI